MYDSKPRPHRRGFSLAADVAFPASGIVLEDEAFEQHACDGALGFGQFADGLELALQVISDGPLAGIEHQTP